MTTTVSAVTQTQSLAAIRNFVRASVSCITYARGLCSDESFEERTFLGLQLKHIVPNSTEATKISRWIEKGAFDALNKNYLREMALCVYNGDCTEILESYCFGFTYSGDGQRAQMTIGSSLQASMNMAPGAKMAPPPFNREVQDSLSFVPSTARHCSKQEVQQLLARIIAKLVEVVQSLPPLLRERVVMMRLTYYDEITPKDYEPPCFAPASRRLMRFYIEEQKYSVGIGSMNTSHHMFSVVIRHPLLSKIHTNFLKHQEVKKSSENSTNTRAADSWLNGTITGPSNLSFVRSKTSGEKCEYKVIHGNARSTTLRQADFAPFTSLPELLKKAPPLRLTEVAYLVIVAFIFTKILASDGKRLQLFFSELKDYLRESCPLDVEPAAALKVVSRLLVEGYLQDTEKEELIKKSKGYHEKTRDAGAGELGKPHDDSGGGAAASSVDAVALKNSHALQLMRGARSSKFLPNAAVEQFTDNAHWRLGDDPFALEIPQRLLQQPQVVEMLSIEERKALERVSYRPTMPRVRRKRARLQTTHPVSRISNHSSLLNV